ncbi:MAG: BolA/IbaG family iron-sulfur metabolism protein [Proteobacteria bacterium]|nr:BolA/IbaG family iron-sulfur metabolism protein [Pseudomonadota bacterium]
MNALSLEDLVASYLDDCHVSVTEQGGHYTITAIGSRFEGLRPVKRQQAVYAAVAELIAAGTIHAVNIRALTPQEAQ